MADKSQNVSTPTIRQILIVALAMGVIAGGGGGALGFILGGQAVSREEETTHQAHGSTSISDTDALSASGMEHSIAGSTKDQEINSAPHSADSRKPSRQEGSHSSSPQGNISSKLTVRELTPIVTNLAEPATNWIRLQSAIVFNPDEMQHPEKTIAELTSDITGYLRTVSLSHLEGADGLRRLQDELSDRATIRSNGKIREFIIETMVVQ